MTGAEHLREHDSEDRRHRSNRDRPQQRRGNRRPQRLVPHRDMGAHDEHHQREPDVRQQCESRVGVIDYAESRSADDQSRDQLPDDHRDAEARQ
jgi:hypothetical protein